MKYFVVMFLLVAQLVCAQPASVQTDQNNGYLALATYVFDIAVDEILDLNDVLGLANTGTRVPKGFKFRVTGGDVVLGPKDDVATGTNYIGEYVSNGGTFPGWTGIKKPTNDDYNWVIAPVGNEVTVTFWMW
jgi:hypothetical protein